jgi:hypothetical protein
VDLKNQDVPRDAAHGFVSHAESFLAQTLGRPFNLKELSDFVETAGASLLGSMYAILREQEGKEKSEIWLKKAMTSLGSTVRLRGADALVKAEITIKDMPHRLAKREELHGSVETVPAQGAAAPPVETVATCECKLESDGTCRPCLRQIASSMENAFRVMTEMAKVGQKTEGVCAGCKVKHGDQAIASIVPGAIRSFGSLEGNKPALMEQVTNLVLQLGMSIGVQEMPLTQEALKKNAPEEEE